MPDPDQPNSPTVAADTPAGEAPAREPAQASPEELLRQAEAKAKEHQDAWLRAKAEAEAAERHTRQQELHSEIELLHQSKEDQVVVLPEIELAGDQLFSSAPSSSEAEHVAEAGQNELEEIPWLSIDLDSSAIEPVSHKEIEFVTAETTADLAVHETVNADEPSFEPSVNPAPAIKAESGTPSNDDDDSLSPDLIARLQSARSSDRAAALADLADISSEESFHLITKSFDDPTVEVRNAAARALYHLHPDLSASFTRALREASPERRRKIGAAIAGSGLATNAINSLTGEGRDRTYDAFSMLFLMAKAGEVQPLMEAIVKHPDQEVRLTAVKLLSLSNQPQILPALRSLAGREHLPGDVHKAVMEAIYVLSNQVREVA